MKPVLPRRYFIKQTSVATGFAALGGFNILRAEESPARKLVVGIMGCNNRGMDHIADHLTTPNVEIGYICDVDRRTVEKGIAGSGAMGPGAPGANTPPTFFNSLCVSASLRYKRRTQLHGYG